MTAEFTVSHAFYEMIKDSPPVSSIDDVHGEVHEIKRMESEQEAAVLQHFTHLAGPWMELRRITDVIRACRCSIYIYG